MLALPTLTSRPVSDCPLGAGPLTATGSHVSGGVAGPAFCQRSQYHSRSGLTPLAAHHSLTLCPLDLYAATRVSHSCHCSALIREETSPLGMLGEIILQPLAAGQVCTV